MEEPSRSMRPSNVPKVFRKEAVEEEAALADPGEEAVAVAADPQVVEAAVGAADPQVEEAAVEVGGEVVRETDFSL